MVTNNSIIICVLYARLFLFRGVVSWWFLPKSHSDTSHVLFFQGPVTQSTDISEAFCLLIKNTLCNTRPVVVLRSIVASVYRNDRVNEHLFTAFTLKLSLLHAFKPQALYWENHRSLCCFLPYAAKTKISSTGTSIARSTTRREHTHGK